MKKSAEGDFNKCVKDCRCDGWKMVFDGTEMELTGPPVQLGERVFVTAKEHTKCGNCTNHDIVVDVQSRTASGTLPTVTRPDGTTLDWATFAPVADNESKVLE